MRFQRSGSPVFLGLNSQREPALLLGLTTTLVLGAVLSLFWKTRVEAQCGIFGNNYCVNQNGINPCPYTTCAATGSGYTCMVGTAIQTELSYSMNQQLGCPPKIGPAEMGVSG